MEKQKIKISEINKLIARYYEINMLKLEDIDFIDENDNKIEIDNKILEEWKFTGLNNTDFISSDFYKNGFNDIEE